MFWKIRKYNELIFLVLIAAIVVSCFSCKADVSFDKNEQSSNLSNLYDDITANINKDSYNELDWMTEEPTGGIIVYDGYKLYDIDNDGKIIKFYNSYWNETLVIYDKMEQETTITYDGDMETGEWKWKINGISAFKNDVYDIIKHNVNY